ncbi:MAG: NUDIX domain-containing protein [Chitinivibrionales bacterium]|nr:NUDIX domain-containing protein [Chitinivibrionales bacterium]
MKHKIPKGEFRDNVCAVIRNREGDKLLVCHRIASPPDEGWQFPQGGIDNEKDLIQEMLRELEEEIGTNQVKVIAISQKVYRYEYPDEQSRKSKGYRGQQQRWVLCELLVDELLINVATHKPEFDAFRWVSPQQALSCSVSFKRQVYQEALTDLGLL